MKNITVAVDDETYRQARVHAAAAGTSVSAMVKGYLASLADSAAGADRGVREMQAAYILPPGAMASPSAMAGDKPVWTIDGKPRQPGALRVAAAGATDADDIASWPADMLASFTAWDEDAFDPLP